MLGLTPTKWWELQQLFSIRDSHEVSQLRFVPQCSPVNPVLTQPARAQNSVTVWKCWFVVKNKNVKVMNTSITIKSAEKKIKVDHSTRAKIASSSLRSARVNKRTAPNSAVHPNDRLSWGMEWIKKTMITTESTTPHLISKGQSFIRHWNPI